jgi:hypothetical protein
VSQLVRSTDKLLDLPHRSPENPMAREPKTVHQGFSKQEDGSALTHLIGNMVLGIGIAKTEIDNPDRAMQDEVLDRQIKHHNPWREPDVLGINSYGVDQEHVAILPALDTADYRAAATEHITSEQASVS